MPQNTLSVQPPKPRSKPRRLTKAELRLKWRTKITELGIEWREKQNKKLI